MLDARFLQQFSFIKEVPRMQEARSWRMVQPGTLSVRGGAMPECVGSQCVARALLLVFRSVDMRTRSEALAQFSYQPRGVKDRRAAKCPNAKRTPKPCNCAALCYARGTLGDDLAELGTRWHAAMGLY